MADMLLMSPTKKKKKNPQDIRGKSVFCFHLLKTTAEFIMHEGMDWILSERTMSYYVQHNSFKTLGYSSFTTSTTKAFSYTAHNYLSGQLCFISFVDIPGSTNSSYVAQ